MTSPSPGGGGAWSTAEGGFAIASRFGALEYSLDTVAGLRGIAPFLASLTRPPADVPKWLEALASADRFILVRGVVRGGGEGGARRFLLVHCALAGLLSFFFFLTPLPFTGADSLILVRVCTPPLCVYFSPLARFGLVVSWCGLARPL